MLNENGQPVSHATVFVSGPRSLPPQRIVTTDEGGNFQVAGLDASLYFVRASAPAYITVPRNPDSLLPAVHRIGDAVTINLIKGGVITGTVTSPTGQPMVQAAVRAMLIRDVDGKPPAGLRFPLERTTDDRGVYRIYGLAAGAYFVSAGGRMGSPYNSGVYDSDLPTYAPSATRDTAVEVVVRAGEETTGVDIRHRGETGHSISGIVKGSTSQNALTNIVLSQKLNGAFQMSAITYQAPDSKGFTFYGVADGDYDLAAHSPGQGEAQTSEPQRVTVKGRDITGLTLTLNSLPSVSGRLVLETSRTPDCKNKRKPLFSETSLMAHRTDKDAKDLFAFPNFSLGQTSPDKSGDFLLRNFAPGQFTLNIRFFAKYWYLRRIERDVAVTQPVKTANVGRQNDLARNGFQLKLGERLSNVTVTLAEGASSVRGALKLAEGDSLPPKLYLHLVPAEKESTEDVLRFFTTAVQTDGTFSVNNVPPGRYWVLARLPGNSEPQIDAKLRAPDEADTRAQIRREAEANKTELELKPCQNVVDYQLPFRISAVKN
ncbi:MAG TPA: carboxypeptidase-like regulatory domain-containing protein [Pyrinomonadaceae bacterium]|nr:carboxypeptidase-like regulatory domain-containing protein [Pyrinomonadaceae bacterium]